MSYLTILLGIILVNNYVLAQFLGICPFLGVSKKLDSSIGMGAVSYTHLDVYKRQLLFVAMYFFFNGGNRNQEDYFLGGRSMGPWVTAMSAQASDMSAWLLMGLPGSILAFGFGQMWIGIGLTLGTAANWIFCAKRLRKFSKAAGDAITLPQYLSNRFATTSKALQIICCLLYTSRCV